MEPQENTISKITVDRDLCIGIASCIALAPQAFELDEENKAVVLPDHGYSDQEILDAARSCPVNAIILEDNNGTQIYP